MKYAIKAYILPCWEAELKKRDLMQKGLLPYQEPGPFIQAMREYMEAEGMDNFRVGNGYKTV